MDCRRLGARNGTAFGKVGGVFDDFGDSPKWAKKGPTLPYAVPFRAPSRRQHAHKVSDQALSPEMVTKITGESYLLLIPKRVINQAHLELAIYISCFWILSLAALLIFDAFRSLFRLRFFFSLFFSLFFCFLILFFAAKFYRQGPQNQGAWKSVISAHVMWAVALSHFLQMYNYCPLLLLHTPHSSTYGHMPTTCLSIPGSPFICLCGTLFISTYWIALILRFLLSRITAFLLLI